MQLAKESEMLHTLSRLGGRCVDFVPPVPALKKI